MSLALIAVLFLALVAAAIVLNGVLRSRRMAYRWIASEWDGRVRTDWAPGNDHVEILVAGVRAEIRSRRSGAEDDPGWTHLTAAWPCERRFRIVLKDTKSTSPVVLPVISTGDGAFDCLFRLELTQGSWARTVLDEALRSQFRDLRRLLDVHEDCAIEVDLSTTGFSVKVLRHLKDDAPRLNAIIELAEAILVRAQSLEKAVEIREVSRSGVAGCPVCAKPVEGGELCPRCQTPHHEDCWKYMGGCAIFGCRTRCG